MNTPPDFCQLFAIADNAARVLSIERARLAEKIARAADPAFAKLIRFSLADEIDTMRFMTREAIAALRYVARQDLHLVFLRVAVWRGKGGPDGRAYLEKIGRRALEIDQARRDGRVALIPGRAA